MEKISIQLESPCCIVCDVGNKIKELLLRGDTVPSVCVEGNYTA